MAHSTRPVERQKRAASRPIEQLRPAEILVDAHYPNRLADSERGLTHVWWSDLPMDSAWAAYGPADKYRQRCEELARLHFRPIGVHACCDAGGEPQFSSVWWRPQMHIAVRAERARQLARMAVALHKHGDHMSHSAQP